VLLSAEEVGNISGDALSFVGRDDTSISWFDAHEMGEFSFSFLPVLISVGMASTSLFSLQAPSSTLRTFVGCCSENNVGCG